MDTHVIVQCLKNRSGLIRAIQLGEEKDIQLVISHVYNTGCASIRERIVFCLAKQSKIAMRPAAARNDSEPAPQDGSEKSFLK